MENLNLNELYEAWQKSRAEVARAKLHIKTARQLIARSNSDEYIRHRIENQLSATPN